MQATYQCFFQVRRMPSGGCFTPPKRPGACPYSYHGKRAQRAEEIMSTLGHRGSRGARLAALLGLALAVAQGTPAQAQQRLLVPAGTVLTVRTEGALSSRTAQLGQQVSTLV